MSKTAQSSMQALRYCRSCSGPRPRAARRCPWCHRSYAAEPQGRPEHLFAVFDSTVPGSTGDRQ